MSGEISDIVRRLRSVLPGGWFGDNTPILDTVLTGCAQAPSWIHSVIIDAKRQLRIGTASDNWLDAIAADFFGRQLTRRALEADDSFRIRVLREIVRARVVRTAVVSALYDLTGRPPDVFEPCRPSDTGCYGCLTSTGRTGLAYGVAGGWGSLRHPYQVFVTAYRPLRTGGASASSWGRGSYNTGYSTYADLSVLIGGVTDAEIFATVANIIPTATLGWVRITG